MVVALSDSLAGGRCDCVSGCSPAVTKRRNGKATRLPNFNTQQHGSTIQATALGLTMMVMDRRELDRPGHEPETRVAVIELALRQLDASELWTRNEGPRACSAIRR